MKLQRRATSCPEDYMYDSASRRCYACSAICIVPDYFCRTKCPGYYYRDIVTLPANYFTENRVEQQRLVHNVFQKPLFWASMACFVVTIVSIAGIIVLCAMHWRNFSRRSHRSTTVRTRDPHRFITKTDPSSSQCKTNDEVNGFKDNPTDHCCVVNGHNDVSSSSDSPLDDNSPMFDNEYNDDRCLAKSSWSYNANSITIDLNLTLPDDVVVNVLQQTVGCSSSERFLSQSKDDIPCVHVPINWRMPAGISLCRGF